MFNNGDNMESKYHRILLQISPLIDRNTVFILLSPVLEPVN